MKKLFLFFFFIILSLSFISSTIETLGTFKQNSTIELIQTCANCTFNNITSIKLGNGTILNLTTPMTKYGTFYNYTLGFSNTESFGNYIVNGVGDLDGVNTIWSYDFEVTYIGQQLSTSNSIIYLVLIIVLFFVFIITLLGINKLPKSNEKDEWGRIMAISYLKYLRGALWLFEWILFIGILFLSSNLAFAYLGEQLFAKVLLTLFKICLGISPLLIIVWISWFFVKFFQDKEFKRLFERGVFPQGKL